MFSFYKSELEVPQGMVLVPLLFLYNVVINPFFKDDTDRK